MHRITVTAEIARPPEVVFAAITDIPRLPLWQESIWTAGLDAPERPVGAGTRFRGTAMFLAQQFGWVCDVIEHDPPARVRYESVEAPLEFTGDFSLSQTENGRTYLTYTFEVAKGLGGLFGKLTEPFVVRRYHRQLETDLETLTELLEGDYEPHG